MAVINTGLTTKGLKSEFFDRFGQVVTYYQDLTTTVKSQTDIENYKFLGTVPQVREWGTGRIAKGLRSESYSVENLKYEATLEIDRDEISDDQTGQIRIRINELAARAATHKDYLLTQLMLNGATAGFNSYDGVTYFNANHVSGDSGAQSNILTPAAVDTSNPTIAEVQTALKDGIARILGFKDDQGEPMANTASGLVAIVPATMYLTFLEALNTTVVQSVKNILEGAARVIAFPRLTDASKWYLCKNDESVRPFIFQDREPLEFNAIERGSEEEFLREKYLYGVRARYAMTYGYWQYCLSLDFT